MSRLTLLALNDLGEEIMSAPAHVEGELHVRAASHLHAFGGQDEAVATGWKAVVRPSRPIQG